MLPPQRYSPYRGLSLSFLVAAVCGAAPAPARAQLTFAEEVAQASYVEPIVAEGETDELAAAKQAEEIEIVRQFARHRGGQPEALAQIIQMSRAFNDAISADLLEELAVAHLRAGDLNLAADARRILAEQFPGTPRAQDALLWLVRLYSSSEMVHARRAPSQAATDMLRQLPPNADLTQVRTNAAVSRQRARRREKTTAAAEGQPAAPYAIHLATQSMSRHPELADNAALAYQRAVAARLAGQQKQSNAFLSPLKHRRAGDRWGDCARMEAWLESGNDERSPKPYATCVYADDPPRLDGNLAEAYWQLALPLPLRAENAESDAVVPATAAFDASGRPEASPLPPPPAGQVQLAYDRDHLYVAIVCEKAPGTPYQTDGRPRPRDGAVDERDHVALRFDVDRDYASYFELLVDSRGWTADRCWGDSAWNPAWYVAASEINSAGDRWIVELAIPWSELTTTPPKSRNAWACSIARSFPPAAGAQPQSWIGPASDRPEPESFGVIRFE
jgi:hypothetical protein